MGKITNVRGASKEFDDMKTNVTNVTNFKSEFKKSEKISKQFLPDINSIIKCFNECCEKLSNLETNFENVKTATWNTDEKHNDMENKMLKLIEQINSLMLKMVNLEERTKKLEKSSSETNRKLLNLESADVYLQEADRMIIEKLSNQTKPMIEAGSRSEDLKHYVDDCLLKVSKKKENNYEEVRNQLQQHE